MKILFSYFHNIAIVFLFLTIKKDNNLTFLITLLSLYSIKNLLEIYFIFFSGNNIFNTSSDNLLDLPECGYICIIIIGLKLASITP